MRGTLFRHPPGRSRYFSNLCDWSNSTVQRSLPRAESLLVGVMAPTRRPKMKPSRGNRRVKWKYSTAGITSPRNIEHGIVLLERTRKNGRKSPSPRSKCRARHKTYRKPGPHKRDCNEETRVIPASPSRQKVGAFFRGQMFASPSIPTIPTFF